MTAPAVVSRAVANRLKAFRLLRGDSASSVDAAVVGVLDHAIEPTDDDVAGKGAVRAVNPDVIAASVDLLRHLSLHSGGHVLLVVQAWNGTARSIIAQIVSNSRQRSSSGSSNDDEVARSAGQRFGLRLAPALAYNLGISYALEPFLSQPPWPTVETLQPSAALNAPASLSSTTQLVSLTIWPLEGSGASSSGIQHHKIQGAGATATSIKIAKLGVPRVSHVKLQDFNEEELHPGGTIDGHGTMASDSAATDAVHDAVASAVQAHFTTGFRYVSCGDVFCVPVPAQHIAAQQVGRCMYFQVCDVQPAGTVPLLVDPAHTEVVLQAGSARGRLPVGCESYTVGAASTSECSTPTLGAMVSASWHPHPYLLGVSGPLLPSTWRRIASLLAPLLHSSTLQLGLRAALLLHGPPGSGRCTAARAASAALGLHFIPFSCYEIKGSTEGKTTATLAAVVEQASRFAPCVLLLRHLEVLAGTRGAGDTTSASQSVAMLKVAEALAGAMEEYGTSAARHAVLAPGIISVVSGGSAPAKGLVLVMGSVAAREDLPVPLARCFTHDLRVEPPSIADHELLLRDMLQSARAALTPEDVHETSLQMAGLLPHDVRGVVADACAEAIADLSSSPLGAVPEPPTLGKGLLPRVTRNHLQQALGRIKSRTATEIGAPQVPNVRWDDIGGLEDVKRAILDTVELPLKHRELFASGLRKRSGVLLYGPPGSGKTLLAKAVASQCSASFMSVKGPELINMYVGESERQVREVFARARRARPCVMFFDELDSLAPARGAAGDSGGVMDRVVAQLLAEIDGVQDSDGGGSEDLFVIGATNRPDLLDSSLMRPGRLDTLIYVGIAKEPSSKLKVLQALSRNDVDLPAIAEQCAPTLTGADLYALCADAWMEALKRRIRQDSTCASATSPPTAVTAAAGVVATPSAPASSGRGNTPAPEQATGAKPAVPHAQYSSTSAADIEHQVTGAGRLRTVPSQAPGAVSAEPAAVPASGPLTQEVSAAAAVTDVAAPSAQSAGEVPPVQVCACDFEAALRKLVPSLSREEIQRYEALRDHYDSGMPQH